MALLIEKYAGAFPAWLAPVQVKVMPIIDKQADYCADICRKLEAKGFRVELDDRNEKIGYRIREAQLEKVPYMLVAGDKEMEAGHVSVRSRKAAGETRDMSIDAFIAMLTEEVETKKR